ncbi:MAG: class I SAM-dependent methyltransferase [Candidatus Aenigmatarchaeota archaeon]
MSFVLNKKGVHEVHHHTSLTKPCDTELEIFLNEVKNLVGKRNDVKILIIGSSPELRELAAKLNVKTTVVANDLEVIERTTKLMNIKNKNEEWLEGDILKLPLTKRSFDIILSDYILSNVPPYNKESFYKRIKELLKKEGYVLIRSIVFKKTAKIFESKISRHFRILEKKFGKTGIFSEYFPIYLMKPK